MADELSARDVIAFRVQAHGLGDRLGEDRLLDAAGRCAVQDSPPGSALLALGARVRGVTPEGMRAALVDQRTLLRTWSLRGAPFVFPTRDAPVFTAGALPPTEAAGRHLLLGVEPALADLDLTLAEAVDLTRAEVDAVLTGRTLAIGELGEQIAERIAARLAPDRRATWEGPGPYAAGQPLGQGVVHFCIRILTLEGVVCFAARVGATAPFALAAEWLGQPIPQVEVADARAELLRRYLRSYGPSTRAGFAAWVGVNSGDTDAWWSLVEDELTQVELGGRAWLLTADLDVFASAPNPQSVRLLPPRDPYTQVRDRATILAPSHHRQVWRAIGEPGAVLVDGRIAGIWRPRKAGRRLVLTVTAFGPISARHRSAVRDEAELVGRLRGASTVEVSFDGA